MRMTVLRFFCVSSDVGRGHPPQLVVSKLSQGISQIGYESGKANDGREQAADNRRTTAD